MNANAHEFKNGHKKTIKIFDYSSIHCNQRREGFGCGSAMLCSL